MKRWAILLLLCLCPFIYAQDTSVSRLPRATPQQDDLMYLVKSSTTGTYSSRSTTIEAVDDMVRHASRFAGSSAGAKILAAYNDLPSTGGTIDASGLEGTQSISSAITLTKPVHLILPAATITCSDKCFSITSSVVIEGVSFGGFAATTLDSYFSPTVLNCTSLTANCITIDLPSGNALGGIVIKNLRLHGNTAGATGSGIVMNGGAASTAIRDWKIEDVFIDNFKEDGIRIRGNVFEGDLSHVRAHQNGLDGILIEANTGIPAVMTFNGVRAEYNARNGLRNTGGGSAFRDFGGYYAANGQDGIYQTGNMTWFGTYLEGNGTAMSNTYAGLLVSSGSGAIWGGTVAGHSIQKYGIQAQSGTQFSISDMQCDSAGTNDFRADSGSSLSVNRQATPCTVSDASSGAQRYDLFNAANGKFLVANGQVFGWSDANFNRVAANSLGTNGGDFYVQGLLSVDKATYFTSGALTLVNGQNNDIAPPNTTFIRASGPTGAFSITGFSSGSAGRTIKLFNTTAQPMTIRNLVGSGANNQIRTLTGADVTLRTGTSFAEFIYDGTLLKWVLTSSN